MKKHDHGGHMVWDDDWCGCKECGQAWSLHPSKGWQPLDDGGNQIKPRFVPKPKLKVKSKAVYRKNPRQ
jgi:hypothetical protein